MAPTKTLNILFLGGAKRVAMGRLFKRAAAERGFEARLMSYELSPYSAIACEAEVIQGTLWRDPEILAKLAEVVEARQVDIVVPFVDPSIAIAARLRDRLAADGRRRIYVPTGSAAKADEMLDKVAAARAFAEAAIEMPLTVEGAPRAYPVIAKPRFGSASKGIMVIDSPKAWADAAIDPAKYLVQEYVADRDEYTVDCFVDSRGETTACQPRLRLATSGGEVTDTVTTADPRLVEAARVALSRLQLRGAVTIQFLRDRSTDRLLIMEINPRLGGGAVVTVYAGADLPGMIIDDALRGSAGEQIAPKADVRMARYQQEVIFMPQSTTPIN